MASAPHYLVSALQNLHTELCSYSRVDGDCLPLESESLTSRTHFLQSLYPLATEFLPSCPHAYRASPHSPREREPASNPKPQICIFTYSP